MDCIATRLPYRQTNAFSKIVLDYIDQAPLLIPFFSHTPGMQGIQKAIEARREFDNRKEGSRYREVLTGELRKQYKDVPTSPHVSDNIESLHSFNTFTVTTAHQNNIFTGPLYFIYKIVHAIKLADELRKAFPEQHFVPVFYIGSEDADIDELNHIHLGGEKLTWKTGQAGAVGRMKVDKDLLSLVTTMEGQLSVLPHGIELISMIRSYYKEGTTIQDATFRFVNELFSAQGLVVLLPDNAALKEQLKPVFSDDLFDHSVSEVVAGTAKRLEAAGYKVQANPREINLFYLKDDTRERIEFLNGRYTIQPAAGKQGVILHFDKSELQNELEHHPGRFSPNVILRGLYQEAILPNIALIGGGGEIAYWLQFRDLFKKYDVPFPVLVLRNSFLVLEKKWEEKIRHLGFTPEDFFLPASKLLDKLVSKEAGNSARLNGSLTALEQLYESFKKQATAVDTTLEKHVEALKQKTVQRLQELEKKMWRAEKRKYADQQRQIKTIKDHLFPGEGLQERHDNLSEYYAKWGKAFLTCLYEHSPSLEQEFVILTER